ncbi:prepilin-type N-terminal cleavage/methylation domain-containing protein [Arsukibacterium sp.]|uniref:type IV pilus modification PilV family protein n=1 Tax=Arsukibacterium sp. TaxID=1977258 RepID=UPI00299D31C5|nr:prepilin-type N-terminal cleavage/methylation domain-containing protein [Arsukibacterium sp.]MDX1539566.1 prepilin-type N-terminal cleavage/methylation domain-containing protein [Arsukibacterium sp.]
MLALAVLVRRQRGVSLIELIIGIVVLAIALSLVTAVLGPLYIKSTDPWHQVRATELGQSMLNDIMARSFDQQSPRSGSMLRCGESGAPACTAQNGDGSWPADPAESAADNRLRFNDVDDFDNFTVDGSVLTNILAEDLADVYRNYQLRVSVSYAAAAEVAGISLATDQVKVITVTVRTPTGSELQFSSYKGNW